MTGNAQDGHLQSLQGSIKILDANGTVMRASIDQLAAMIADLSARLARLETGAPGGGRADAVGRKDAARLPILDLPE